MAAAIKARHQHTHTLGEFCEFIDSGRPISPRLDNTGIPAYEVGHILPGELKAADVFVSPDSDKILEKHDLLTGRVGGLGAIAEYQSEEPASFSDNVLRLRPKEENRGRSAFVAEFLNCTIGNTQLLRDSRGSLQKVVTQQSLGDIIVPELGGRETELIAAMDAARSERRSKLAEAEGLLAGVDGYLREALGLAAAPAAGRQVFAVRGQSAFERIDPHFHAPEFERIQQILAETACQPLGEIAAFSDAAWNPKDYPHPAFRYIEISTVNPKTGEALWNEVAIAEAPSRARKPVQSGDIIVSLTRPHHGSIAYLGPEFDGCIASTGFAVIRNVAPTVNRAYLWAILRAQFSLAQMRQRSSGGNYPAITEPELQKITIPVPDMETQTRIAAEVQRRHELANQLRTEAETGWAAARQWFEGAVLG